MEVVLALTECDEIQGHKLPIYTSANQFILNQ